MASHTALSIYDTTIPIMITSLRNLSHLLTKGQQHLQAKSLPDSTLLEARIADDMAALPFQIQTACNTAKFTAVRLGGLTLSSFEDNEKTFDELHKRIEATVGMLEKDVKREAFEGADSKEFEFRGLQWTGLSYANGFAVPNFFFHVSCAYMILRGKGVDVGKLDFLLGTKAGDWKKQNQ